MYMYMYVIKLDMSCDCHVIQLEQREQSLEQLHTENGSLRNHLSSVSREVCEVTSLTHHLVCSDFRICSANSVKKFYKNFFRWR